MVGPRKIKVLANRNYDYYYYYYYYYYNYDYYYRAGSLWDDFGITLG